MKRYWRRDHTLYKESDTDIAGDPPAFRVYRMERDIAGWHNNSVTPEEDLIAMAEDACKHFRVKNIPEIYIVAKRVVDIGWCTSDGIYLNTKQDGQNYHILIHEISHWICDELYPEADLENQGHAHGREWAFIYIELMDRFKFLPRWLATQLFDRYGIDY